MERACARNRAPLVRSGVVRGVANVRVAEEGLARFLADVLVFSVTPRSTRATLGGEARRAVAVAVVNANRAW